ncbi:MAG: response regulator, partial [Flavobacteriales bacterium]|nr:response regulator [Flavobacteriales bacterium]
MTGSPIPSNENERLERLEYYNILDTDPEEAFDDLTSLAAKLLNVPVVLVSLLDNDRQWFKSKFGLDVDQTPREVSFCQYAIMQDDVYEVYNALQNDLFRDNPLVTGNPKIRFYAGAPLVDEDVTLGTLCAIDFQPRKLNEEEKRTLTIISKTIIRLIKYRRDQQEAERLAKAKDEFLSNMSHEIRTPLNAIMGFTDLLSGTALDHTQRSHIDTVARATKNLTVIVNDILDVSKLESGRFELEKQPFQLEKMLKHVVQLQSVKAKEKGIKLMSSIDNELPGYILGDETRLTQILYNLIGNAIKFTSEGEVELKVLVKERSHNTTRISFEIKDNGIGIEKDKLEQIFDRFTQASESTTRLYGGTGLGLNIVKKLVDMHGGLLDVESELGKGSIFSVVIEFDLDRATDHSDEEIETKKTEINSLAGLNILLAEDNEHNQILAKTYLERNNAVVDIAGNGDLAVEMIKTKEYDVVIMDLQMPVMDGFESTRIMREDLKMEMPIIACSAHSLVGDREHCMRKGMTDYIAKPYTERELVGTIMDHAARKN